MSIFGWTAYYNYKAFKRYSLLIYFSIGVLAITSLKWNNFQTKIKQDILNKTIREYIKEDTKDQTELLSYVKTEDIKAVFYKYEVNVSAMLYAMIGIGLLTVVLYQLPKILENHPFNKLNKDG